LADLNNKLEVVMTATLLTFNFKVSWQHWWAEKHPKLIVLFKQFYLKL